MEVSGLLNVQLKRLLTFDVLEDFVTQQQFLQQDSNYNFSYVFYYSFLNLLRLFSDIFVYFRSFAVSTLNRNPVSQIQSPKYENVANQNNSCVDFGFINVRSLFCHIDKLRIFINEHKPDIFCAAETWLTGNINDQSVALTGYNILRYDRAHKRGGGICIYYKTKFNIKAVHSSIHGIIEVMMAELVLPSITILVVVCYIPKTPVQTDLDHFQEILSSRVLNYSHFIICGDLNINMLNKSHKFHDLLKANHLISVRFSPTRGNNWLDQCILSESDYFRVVESSQHSLPDISDHDFILISYKARFNRSKIAYTHIYDYHNMNTGMIMDYISKLNWSALYLDDNVNSSFQLFYNNLYYIHEKCVPIKTIVDNESVAPWFNARIAKSMSVRDYAYNKFRKTTDIKYLDLYRRERNRVTCLIRSSKQRYFFGNHKLTMKRIWKNIRCIGLGASKSSNFTGIEPSTINRYLCDVPPKSIVLPLPNFEIKSTNVQILFSFNIVSEIDIFKAVYQIKSNTPGHDKINLTFLKNILSYVISPLTYLINDCIMRCVFPDIWKTNIVIPIMKKKNIDSLDNLRPISMVSIISKVFEILLRDQINQHLEKHTYLSQFQSGFRNNHSTSTALLHIVDELSHFLDKPNSFTVLVLLDFSKAFDSLNHILLLQKMMLLYNFDSTAIKLMFSYLSDRYQKVLVNGSESNSEPIPAGVFQGSILGPTLFSLFINDLPLVIKYSKYHMYADDCQIYLGGNRDNILDVFNNINSDLSDVFTWSASNGISLNIAKTQAIFISRNNFPVIPDIFINDMKIPILNHVNNLGICINSSLTWNTQVVSVCNKINSILYGLKLHKNICPKNVRVTLSKSLVIPHILYYEFLYINCDSTSRNFLQVALNNIVRYVNGLRKYDHVSAMFNEFFGCTMIQFIYYRSLLLLYKIINNRAPSYLYNKIKFGSARNCKILLPVNRSTLYNNSSLFSIFTIWNRVPAEIRSVKPFAKFKSTVFDFIKNNI